MNDITCSCGAPIHPKRVEILKKNNSRICCLNCSTTKKMVGFQVVAGKTEYFIEPCSPEQFSRLNSLDRKTY
jgi:hypothetical protein